MKSNKLIPLLAVIGAVSLGIDFLLSFNYPVIAVLLLGKSLGILGILIYEDQTQKRIKEVKQNGNNKGRSTGK